ncbi:MAG: hypothetical protein WB699_14015 [Bacteroidota bacterium]
MKRVMVLLIAAVVSTFTARSQEFKKVVDIVVEMESSLKAMIAKEEGQRKAEVASLQTEVAGLRTALASSAPSNPSSGSNLDAASTAGLVQRIEALEKRVGNDRHSEEFAVLTGQLGNLLGELKKTLDDAKARPAPVAPTLDVSKMAPPTPSLPSIKVGLLAQVQGQAVQEQTSAVQDANPLYHRHWQRQVFVRRLRILAGGELAKNTTFFFESDAPNIGKVESNGAKASKVQMYVQDAQVQHVVAPEFGVIAGLQLVGITRNGLQSAASLMALDYGAYQFATSTPLDNNVGRDLGVNFRGFLADERLEYRAGVFSGRNTNLYSPLRSIVRFNYAFKDREKGFYYTGTTLGKGEILSIGGGVDVQGSYHAFAVDGFVDKPLGEAGSLTLSLGLSLLDGGGSDNDSTYFTGVVPKQSVIFAEGGYFFKDWNLQPYLRFESQSVHATVLKQVGATVSTLDLQNSLRSSARYGVGVNYYLSGHNANVKVLYEWVSRNRLAGDPTQFESATNGQLTIQMQYFTY